MTMSFRRKFHLVSSKPKNPTADDLRVALRKQFDDYLGNFSDIPSSTMKPSQKSLRSIQKCLLDIPSTTTNLQIKIDGIPLDEHSTYILVGAITQVKCVCSLSLAKCNLSTRSLELCSQLLANPTIPLEVINFSQNKIVAEGLLVLANALKQSPNLTSIKLSQCELTDEMAEPLLEAMKIPVLREFDLSKNSLSSKFFEPVHEICKKNVYVTWVDLRGNEIPNSDLEKLQPIFERNAAVSSILVKLLAGACRRNFKSKLMTFRTSIQDRAERSSIGDTPQIQSDEPLYKWLSKGKPSSVGTTHTQSRRYEAVFALDIGKRREMQDVVCLKGFFQDKKNQDFFALFDGHGGREAASYCAERLHVLVGEALSEAPDRDVPESLKLAFARCQKEMTAWSTITGTTAVVIVIIEGTRYICNLGDSRAVVARNGICEFVTHDHKPADPGEAARVTAAGGTIMNNRVNDQLSITRALGDSSLSPWVIAVPDVTVQEITPEQDEFIILASDGIWDVFDGEQVIDMIVEQLKIPNTAGDSRTDTQRACEEVMNQAIIRGSEDNVSIVLIFFNRKPRVKLKGRRNSDLTHSYSHEVVSKMSDLDPLFTMSDSEINTLDELEQEKLSRRNLSPTRSLSERKTKNKRRSKDISLKDINKIPPAAAATVEKDKETADTFKADDRKKDNGVKKKHKDKEPRKQKATSFAL